MKVKEINKDVKIYDTDGRLLHKGKKITNKILLDAEIVDATQDRVTVSDVTCIDQYQASSVWFYFVDLDGDLYTVSEDYNKGRLNIINGRFQKTILTSVMIYFEDAIEFVENNFEISAILPPKGMTIEEVKEIAFPDDDELEEMKKKYPKFFKVF